MSAFEWRSQTRLLDEVADALRERIYSGIYAPGAILRQEQIATEFGISRTPLREAFRVLERDGLVVHQAGRSVRVASADLNHDQTTAIICITMESQILYAAEC